MKTLGEIGVGKGRVNRLVTGLAHRNAVFRLAALLLGKQVMQSNELCGDDAPAKLTFRSLMFFPVTHHPTLGAAVTLWVDLGHVTIAGRTGLFEQVPEHLVLAPGRFEIEHKVLDREPEVIHRLLQRVNSLRKPLVGPLDLCGRFLQLGPLTGREGRNLTEQFRKLSLKLVFCHVTLFLSPKVHPPTGPPAMQSLHRARVRKQCLCQM